MTALWLHLRTSPIRWALPVLVALDMAVIFLRGRHWIGVWPETGAAAQVPAYLLGVVGAGAACCASGCLFGGGREPARLTSENPGSKIPAIKKASADGPAAPKQTRTAQQLVKSLESDDPAVRFYAIRGLQNLTGETFGYVWYADEVGERRPAVEKWKRWLGTTDDSGTLAEGTTGQK